MAEEKFNGEPTEPTATERAELWRKVEKIKFAMLITHDLDGALTARPLTVQQAEGQGALWFFIAKDGGIAEELARDPRVLMNLVDLSDNFFVALAGTGQVVEDFAKARELWNPMVGAWFPQGVDDPNLALLRIDVEKGEYWDPGSSKLVQAFAMAKAALTRTPPRNVGEHREFRN